MHFRRKRRTAGEVSLSDTLETDGDGNALSLQDTISCEDEGLNAVDDHDRYYSMYRALFSSLSPREREVIRLRYGLGAAAPLPQHEIARRMNLSRQLYLPYRKASPREAARRHRRDASIKNPAVRRKKLDTRLRMRYNNKVAESGKHSAELCKGSTTDSDSVCEGSNPSSAATWTT